MWFRKLLAPTLFLAALTVAPASPTEAAPPVTPTPQTDDGPCKLIMGIMVCW